MMVDSVIVTVTVNGKNFDMELPANVPISMLKPGLIESLRKKGINISPQFGLVFNGGRLFEAETLYSLEVWDGSVLSITNN